MRAWNGRQGSQTGCEEYPWEHLLDAKHLDPGVLSATTASINIRRIFGQPKSNLLLHCILRLTASVGTQILARADHLTHLVIPSFANPWFSRSQRAFGSSPTQTTMAAQLSRCTLSQGTRCPLATRPVSRPCAVAAKAVSKDTVATVRSPPLRVVPANT